MRRASHFGIAAIWLLCGTATAAPGGVNENLKTWLRADRGISVADGDNVLHWSDSSGNGNDATFNPENPYGELPPVFDAANPGANDQPSVRFNNMNAMEIDLSWLAGSDYTIFVVSARDRFGLANFYISGDTFAQDQNLVLGYENTELLRFSHLIRDLDVAVEPYVGQPLWSIDTFRFSTESGKETFRDGVVYGTAFQYEPLASNTGTTLGHFRAFGTQYWFEGDLAEVIVYDRKLTLDEQFQVESELAKRYDRPVPRRDHNSTWTASAPVIDGLAFDPEWNLATSIPIQLARSTLGVLKFLNDKDFLYVLMDITIDTIDDPPVDPLNGDYWSFVFDVDEDQTIDANLDLNFTFFQNRTALCRQFFLGPSRLTGCFGTESQFAWQFAESPAQPLAHHVVELAFNLQEIGAASGDTVRSGFRVRSTTPYFVFATPPDLFDSFIDLFKVSLADDPADRIFEHGFEDPPD